MAKERPSNRQPAREQKRAQQHAEAEAEAAQEREQEHTQEHEPEFTAEAHEANASILQSVDRMVVDLLEQADIRVAAEDAASWRSQLQQKQPAEHEQYSPDSDYVFDYKPHAQPVPAQAQRTHTKADKQKQKPRQRTVIIDPGLRHKHAHTATTTTTATTGKHKAQHPSHGRWQQPIAAGQQQQQTPKRKRAQPKWRNVNKTLCDAADEAEARFGAVDRDFDRGVESEFESAHERDRETVFRVPPLSISRERKY